MKWRGQGLLIVAVLSGAAAYWYQWTSFEKLQDYSFSYGINYLPYKRLVAEFVEREKRWPEPGEVDINSVAEGGVIRNAELLENGEIRFAFSAWTIKSGYAEMSFVPSLNTSPTVYGTGRLNYACVDVDPPGFESVVCRREGALSRAEIAAENVDAFARWQSAIDQEKKEKADFADAVSAAESLPTLCDTLWIEAQDNVLPCAEGINPSLAAQIRQRSQHIFNGPRLRPELIARNPDMLTAFNRECEENWNVLVALAKINDESLERCF